MDGVTDALDPALESDLDPVLDPAPMREQYHTAVLTERDLADDPMSQFVRWFKDATSSTEIHEPNAMVVSTASPDGRPSSRTVLLKHYDERGFVFYTNYGSRKGAELAANPYASLLFPWHPIARQVIVTGAVTRVGRDETAAYFRTRPHGSQLGAWASEQSSVIASRAELLARYEELAARYPDDEQVPVPPHWGGYLVVPDTVEFWQGHENRLHDRLRYVYETGGSGGSGGSGGTGTWRVERLSP
ncbi:pyridoxamine 5'-phosphate oxidase [Streptomyces sp. TRM64462]|uniref:pyridoxamine 5'-phosphate oxidase n=1 Tax=Streptomyces sp. TRM64462 TaxID=2741726 RepID=UPI0015861B06|nr:pyridoxamine 5'-phosphate oxidase [Streptomyces sp. TRM64462]